ncbi:MAG: BrnA antitoxin family protein [Nostoc sp. NOS(2021)]|uniref:BrnA antitoxin family protein n=1 Tax=unclassified Nostoc TaxID=2593658 RepID=UPI00345A8C2D|nr:BrnA antitoxin family protein [Nostoc sp. NOS(2021)]
MGVSQEATLIQLDQDILDWFKSKGKGYQSLINSALCSYIEHNSSLLIIIMHLKFTTECKAFHGYLRVEKFSFISRLSN